MKKSRFLSSLETSECPRRPSAPGWNTGLHTGPVGLRVFHAWSGRKEGLRVRRDHQLQTFPELNASFLICETKWQKTTHRVALVVNFASGCKVLS